VTVREYDVLRLLADRVGNKKIGSRPHISPRPGELTEYAAALRS
jgi:DNA-binding CsgD family transcriptional regulator